MGERDWDSGRGTGAVGEGLGQCVVRIKPMFVGDTIVSEGETCKLLC